MYNKGTLNTILVMHIVQRLEVKEIAKTLGIPYSAVVGLIKNEGVKLNCACMVPSDGYRYCSKCDRILKDKEFNKGQSKCRKCARAISKAYRRKPTTKYKEYLYTIDRFYGLSEEDLRAMTDEQVGCCGICGDSLDTQGVFHVDHDHTTGIIRGLLCSSCNTGLGHFKDDVVRLAKAINYLEGT